MTSVVPLEEMQVDERLNYIKRLFVVLEKKKDEELARQSYWIDEGAMTAP